MDRRRLLLILAVFVALIGTALVFLYVKSASKVATTSALVATANIAPGDSYNTALSAGKLQMKQVAQSVVDSTPGYVSSTTALTDQVATGQIYQGQVVVASQFSKNSADVTATQPALSIPKGMIAISVNLTDPDRVAGNIENGSQVAIFVTGDLTAGGASAQSGSTTTVSTTTTRLLLPKVLVLNVGSPQPPTTQTTTDSTGKETTEQLPRTLLTIAVTQKEAQKVIVSSKALNLTFGLLTDTSVVHPGPGTSTLVASLFR
jgi:pilus assembly protein CpaB